MIKAWKNGLEFSNYGNPRSSLGEITCPNVSAIEQLQPDYLTEYILFPVFPRRTQGRYDWPNGTVGYLTIRPDGYLGVYVLVMRFTNPHDGQALYERIRAGTIRPKINFERPEHCFELPETVIGAWRRFWWLVGWIFGVAEIRTSKSVEVRLYAEQKIQALREYAEGNFSDQSPGTLDWIARAAVEAVEGEGDAFDLRMRYQNASLNAWQLFAKGLIDNGEWDNAQKILDSSLYGSDNLDLWNKLKLKKQCAIVEDRLHQLRNFVQGDSGNRALADLIAEARGAIDELTKIPGADVSEFETRLKRYANQAAMA